LIHNIVHIINIHTPIYYICITKKK